MEKTLFSPALSGTVPAISSKSEAHRALICAALSDKPTNVICEYTNNDIDATVSCLNSLGANIVLRCPIIPGLNDREEHFRGIADIANKHNSIIRVELEPYHSLGKGKATAIGKDYPLGDMKSASKDDAKVWLEAISKYTDKKIIIS